MAHPWLDIEAYVSAHADTYAGTHVEGDGQVVRFTTDVETHREALFALVHGRCPVRVEAASRSWEELDAARERLTRELLVGHRHPAFLGVGIGLDDAQQHVVTVLVQGDISDDEVRALCAPEPVAIQRLAGTPRAVGRTGLRRNRS